MATVFLKMLYNAFMSAKPIREGYHTITPYLVVQNAPRLIEFLSAAFGGELIGRMSRPDGSVMHAEMRIGDSMLMMGEGAGEFSPTPTSIYLYVPDCDAVYQQALAAGGTSTSQVRDMPSGERYGGVKDPCGNTWWVATHVADLSPEEQEKPWKAFKR
jgi:PhnB protein